MKQPYQLLLLLVLLFLGCRSPQKLYEQGMYDKAYFSALDYLKKNPSNVDALKVLPDAYYRAVRQYEASIYAARNTGGKEEERLSKIYNGYLSLQEMHNAYQEVSPVIPSFSPADYSLQLDSAAEAAAAFHYNRGNFFMDKKHNEKNAQKAYVQYQKADSYVHGYKDVLEKQNVAYELAFTDVVVRTFDQKFGRYNLNGIFFENDVVRNLNNIAQGTFYKFYSASEASSKNIPAGQYMDLAIYDIWFGKLFENNYSYQVSKELPDGKTAKTVTATVFVSRRVIEAKAILDCNIFKTGSSQPFYFNRFPARYTWENLTGRYTGDSRALSDRDRAILGGVFNNPPSYDNLYRELTRQIMNDFIFQMRTIYY